MLKNIQIYDDKIMKDGERYRIPIHLMDSLQRSVVADASKRTATARHSPGSVALTGADRQTRATMYQAADAKLSSRWKNPPALDAPQPVKDVRPTPAPATDMAARYQAVDKKLTERWRNGGAA